MGVLGIDVGGSGIKGAIVNQLTGGFQEDRFRLPTPEGAEPEAVAATIAQLVQNFNYQGPIGVGFPSVIHNGYTQTAANISKAWIGINAGELLSRAAGSPVYMVNDADAAGVAEMTFGVGKEYPKGVALLLTIGTGVGSALFVDGKLMPNTELGHVEIRGKDAEWRCSDAARVRKEYSWAAWAKRWQEYLDMLERLFWPDLIIIGGGVSKQGDKFLPLLNTKAKLLTAQLLNQAGIVGAAMFAADQAAQAAQAAQADSSAQS